MSDNSTFCSRRKFLCHGLCGVASLATGAVSTLSLAGCASIAHVRATMPDNRSLTVPSDAFADSRGVLVHHPELKHPVYVHKYRKKSGPNRFSAVLTTCTHRGCRVAPIGERISCPCHGSQFANDGSLLSGPADEPLTRFPVEVKNETIAIRLTPTDQ